MRFWIVTAIMSLGAAALATTASPTAAYAQAPDKEFTISAGETLTFNARGVTRVTVGFDKIANVKPSGDNQQLILTGRSPGTTTVNLFSNKGQKTLLIRVVSVNPESLASEVREVLGERSGVDVRVVKGRVLLEGEVASEIYKQKIDKLVSIYPEQVLNFTQFREAFVEGARMVALEMYFINLAVTNNDRVGLHWGEFIGANASYGLGDVPLYYQDNLGEGVLPKEANPERLPRAIGVTGGSGVGYWSLIGNINLAIDLIESQGLIKSIKRGVIVTETGTDADYHAGGTLLIRVNNGVIEKVYGMTVKVKPVLDFENRVKLSIEVDISDLDKANAVGDIPALRNNKLTAVVNMIEGQSVLVNSQLNTLNTGNEQGWWLLGRIPILGWLFKGRSYTGTQTDSALFVTPRVYEPGGKVHNTLINGVFERLLDAGAEAEDIPELGNTQAASGSRRAAPAAKPAAKPASKPKPKE